MRICKYIAWENPSLQTAYADNERLYPRKWWYKLWHRNHWLITRAAYWCWQ